MPTYEYECLKCKRVFEIRQRISEPALTVCDVCGGEVRRLLSAAPFILKGEGWYVTDYPSESRKQALQSEKSSSDKSSSDKSSDKTSDKAASSDKSSDKTSDKAADKPAAKGTDGTSSASTPGASTTTKSD
jgi:putative FmdB family regulatory protein